MNTHYAQQHIDQLASQNVSYAHIHDELGFENEYHLDLDVPQHAGYASVRIYPSRVSGHVQPSEKTILEILNFIIMSVGEYVEKSFLYFGYILERIDSYILYVYRTVKIELQSERVPLSLKIVQEELALSNNTEVKNDLNTNNTVEANYTEIEPHESKQHKAILRDETPLSRGTMVRYVGYLVYKKIMHGE
jgi:hypothetical protein